MNSIFDTESKIIYFMGSNKYIITKIKCWPVFKQDPRAGLKRGLNPLFKPKSRLKKKKKKEQFFF